jgi:ribosomal protein L17
MKKIILSVALLALVMVSCNQKAKQDTDETTVETSTEQYACSMHPEITGKKGDVCTECGMKLEVVQPEVETTQEKVEEVKPVSAEVKATLSTDAIVADYLAIKNALAKDDSKLSATLAKKMNTTLGGIDASKVSANLKGKYSAFATNAAKQSEAIVANAGKIDMQRTAFAVLSKEVTDLVTTFGTTKKLYQDYCPMYNEGKSGYWISEMKEIKNPYYGAEMLECGGMIKQIQ